MAQTLAYRLSRASLETLVRLRDTGETIAETLGAIGALADRAPSWAILEHVEMTPEMASHWDWQDHIGQMANPY